MSETAFADLVRIPTTPVPDGMIPWPPLGDLYLRLKKVETSNAMHLERARQTVDHVATLGAWFEASCRRCEEWANEDQPFHPRHDFSDAHRSGAGSLGKTKHMAALLERNGERLWNVEDGPGLAFRYVEHEVPPARVTPTGSFEPTPGFGSRPSTSGILLDLLLADADRRPVFTEVKLRRDTTPFLALIQVLTLTAQLVSSSQRRRMARHYDERLVADGKPSAMVILLPDPPTMEGGRLGRDWRGTYDLTRGLIGPLMKEPGVSRYLDRLSIVTIEMLDDEPRFRLVADGDVDSA